MCGNIHDGICKHLGEAVPVHCEMCGLYFKYDDLKDVFEKAEVEE